MKVINIIIIFLLILFIGLNIFHAVYVQKNQIQQKINDIEQFVITFKSETDPDGYKIEKIDANDFQTCEKDPTKCTTTYAKFAEYNKEIDKKVLDTDNIFFNKYSNYDENYSYKNIKSMGFGYRYYNDIMLRNPLLTYRCVNLSPAEIKIKLDEETNKFPYIYKKLYIHNENLLVKYIASQLEAIKNNIDCNAYSNAYDSNTKPYCSSKLKLNNQANRGQEYIFGPIYVCVSQAPYLRNGDTGNNIIKARFDVIQNERAYYVQKYTPSTNVAETKTETDTETGQFSSLFAEIIIILPLYEMSDIKNSRGEITHANMKQLSLTTKGDRVDTFDDFMNQFYCKNSLCALKCNKSPLYCGCLNANEDYMKIDSVPLQNRPYIDPTLNTNGIKTYRSVCLDVINGQNQQKNFSMMYYINPYNGNFTNLISNIIR